MLRLFPNIQFYENSLAQVGGEPTIEDLAVVLKKPSHTGLLIGILKGLVLIPRIVFSQELYARNISACMQILAIQKAYQIYNNGVSPANIEGDINCLEAIQAQAQKAEKVYITLHKGFDYLLLLMFFLT